MLRDELKARIAKAAGVSPREVFLEHPENPAHGDYATNIAFALARKEKKSPLEVANTLVKNLRADFLEKVEAVSPGFINFFITKEYLAKVTQEILKRGAKFGQGKLKKQTIVIEYSSPNIAKPLGVHHLRSTIIGQALVDLLRFAGYRVISLSFPGDWGTQFGLLIAGYKRWGDPKKIKAHPIDGMLNLYVRFSQAAKADPRFLEEGRAEFKKLEEGNRENRKLWKWFLAESLRDFERVYTLLGVKIEHTIGESFYESELNGLIKDALERGVAKRGTDGSVVVPVPGSQTPEIIQKADGATIFTTRELAAIRHRLKKWKADTLLYVAANQQTFHLEQVFRSAELLSYARREQLVHVKFGMMLGPGGKKFATREGKLIPLIDVLQEAIDRAEKVVQKLNPKLAKTEKKKIAKIVGIGAVKFFDLLQHRHTDIIFDWERMLDLKSSSAPYIQYTHARLKSILRKADRRINTFDSSVLQDEDAAILRALVHFPEVVEDSAKRYEPNRLAEYLLRLAEGVNIFYERSPVLKAEKPLRNARLALIAAAAVILKSGLGLLGIVAPERM